MPIAKGDPFHRSRAQGARYAKAVNEMLANGAKPLLITRVADPATWLRWREWYSLNGLEFHMALMDEQGKKTVPCVDPFQVVL
jgi:hypothetical protein